MHPVVRLWLGLILVSTAVSADPMTLSQALAYARDHQPSLIAARARVDVARAQADLPRAASAVRVGAAAEVLGGTNNNTTASYASLGFLDVARIGGTPANAPVSWRPEPSTLVGISAHEELFDFGRLDTLGDALDLEARAASETTLAQTLDVELFVEESFYAVLGAKAVLQASDAAVTRATTHRDFAKARVTAQLMSPIESTRAEADLARYEVDRVRASGSLEIARAILAAAIGSPAASVDASTDDIAFGAAGKPPEVRAAQDQLDAQKLQTKAIRGELLPDLGVSAELTGRAGGADVAANPGPAGNGWIPDVPNWDALLVLTVPLYDRTITARADVSRRLESVRAAELSQISEDVRTTAERAGISLNVELAAQPALQRAVDAAQANLDQAEARFTSGLGNSVELSDAQALLTQAQIQLAVGQFQRSRARARLARALAESSR